MKIYDEGCKELKENGGILKDRDGTFYCKPGYVSHRVDGPAIEWIDGSKFWWYENKFIMKTKGDVTPDQVEKFQLLTNKIN